MSFAMFVFINIASAFNYLLVCNKPPQHACQTIAIGTVTTNNFFNLDRTSH